MKFYVEIDTVGHWLPERYATLTAANKRVDELRRRGFACHVELRPA